MKITNFLIPLLLFSLLSPKAQFYAQEQAEESVFHPTPARPSDLLKNQESSEEDEENDTDTEEEITEENQLLSEEEEFENGRSLTDYPNLIYTAFVIQEEEVEVFLEFIDNNEELVGQIEIEEINSEEYDGQAFMARYSESASEDKQPILFSAHTQYETEEEAVAFGEETLTLYPDLFFDFEVYEVEGQYDVLFGIRIAADTTIIWYDEEEEMIQYNETRPDFTYQVEEDEEDPYQEEIQERFPDQFEFNSETNEEGINEVTMTHVNSPYDQTADGIERAANSDEEETSDEDEFVEEESSESLGQIDSNSADETEASLTSQNVEQSNTGLLGFRDNIISFMNERNISSNNIILYLVGGFALLVGLLLIVVGKR